MPPALVAASAPATLYLPYLPLRRWLCMAFLALAGAASAAGFDSPLVSSAWLQAHAGRDPNLIVLDASPTPMHRAGHIPGAIAADAMMLMSHEMSVAVMAQQLKNWGLSTGKKVLIYDQGGSYFAPRLHHELYRLGFPASDLAILDGGLAKWRASGGAVTPEPTPAATPGSFEPGPLRDAEVRVDLEHFLAATADRSRQLTLDALSAGHHFGASKFFSRAGHVPHSVSWPADDFFNADKTFKSAAEIRRMGAHLGITPEHVVHSHCGGGGAAAVPFFALKFLAGYPKVTLFPGSQMEWLRDSRELPFWTYAAPMMLRDADWVAGWNDRMLRMFGASKLSIVDVRPAAAYAQGHLPFAVSLPAGDLVARMRQPEQVATLLGQAGVDPSHEAVIVSEGALDEAAALAYLTLVQAGQRQVSLLMTSVDEWGLRGFELSKERTVVGKATSPMAQAVAAVDYPLRRPGINKASAPEAAPLLFLAMGPKPPAKTPPGTLIHLPYAGLLNSDGTPRPAKELWARLDKAGVSPYARIVLVGEEPGPVAVGYVLLKLMGYADVQTQLQ